VEACSLAGRRRCGGEPARRAAARRGGEVAIAPREGEQRPVEAPRARDDPAERARASRALQCGGEQPVPLECCAQRLAAGVVWKLQRYARARDREDDIKHWEGAARRLLGRHCVHLVGGVSRESTGS